MNERMDLLRLSIEQFFGYASISKSIVDDRKIDVHKIAKELKCIAVEGVLEWGFVKGFEPLKLTFGEKLDKKEIKRLTKELKNAQTTRNMPR
jgi:hypothetical protein